MTSVFKNLNYIFIFSIIFLVIGIFLTIHYIDIPLSIFITENINKCIYNFFNFITNFGSFKYIVLMNIFILLFFLLKLYFSKNKNIKDKNINTIKLLLISGLTQSIVSIIIHILKFLFGRARPFHYLSNNDLIDQFTFFNFQYEFVSFPSGHSSGIWAFIICLIIIFKNNKYSKLLIIPGILISISRIILNVHYLSDVFVGGVLGIIASKMIMKFFVKILLTKC